MDVDLFPHWDILSVKIVIKTDLDRVRTLIEIFTYWVFFGREISRKNSLYKIFMWWQVKAEWKSWIHHFHDFYIIHILILDDSSFLLIWILTFPYFICSTGKNSLGSVLQDERGFSGKICKTTTVIFTKFVQSEQTLALFFRKIWLGVWEIWFFVFWRTQRTETHSFKF